MTTADVIFEMHRVDAGYGQKQVLHGVSMCLRKGEVLGLVGTNGAGKSTILKVFGGTLRQWNGRVVHKTDDISAVPAYLRSRRGIGFLLPSGQVFPSMTVDENLRLSRALAKRALESRPAIFDAYAWFPELKPKQDRRAGLLSGGERQMLAISIVMVQCPEVLLLDEPAEGIAADLGIRMMEGIVGYVRQRGACALVVEHNTALVLKYCSTVHFMAQGQIQASFCTSDAGVEQTLSDLYFGPY